MAVITSPNVVSDGLILHLDAGNSRSYSGSGVSWLDLCNTDISMTAANGPSHSTSSNIGYWTLDGSDDYFYGSVTSKHSALVTNEGSWCCWFRTHANGNYEGLLQIYDNGYTDYLYVRLYNNRLYSYMENNDSGLWAETCTTNSSSVSINTWHYYTLTSDASSVKCYLNGSLHHTVSDCDWLNDALGTSPSFRIGLSGWGDQYFDGDISMVSYYDKALTASEVSQNYHAHRKRFGV